MFPRPSLLGVVYLLVGLVLASRRHYLDGINTAEEALSAVLAIVLWPLLLLGVDLHVHL